jgi:glycogen operon protein
LAWFDALGGPVTPEQWNDPQMRVVQMLRAGPAAGDRDALAIINGRLDPVVCSIPPGRPGSRFELVWDSSWERPEDRGDGSNDRGLSPILSGNTVHVDGLTVRLYLSAP